MDRRTFNKILAAAGAFTAASLWSALSAPAQSLPEGRGKQLIEASCVGCHQLRSVTNAGYSQQDWQTVVTMMVNVGAPLARDQIAELAEYLGKNFPEKPKPAAVMLPGSTRATIKEWLVPTPGSRPHDPLATPDGAIWYTGQYANVLGRLDPKTGEFKEYRIKKANSGPHGLRADRDGNIWFTANFAGYIGKLDPKTGDVTEYPMPDSAARDTHTLVFDQKGVIWFSVQSANRVGRLDPKTGDVKLLTVPTAKARPYGIAINSKGVAFFDEFGANKIASIDPDTLEIHEYALPNPGARPRRIAITSDDVVWYSDFARGYLGRLDPKTGKATEWQSPGGAKSQPYAIAAVNDELWYSESGTKPNTMVRFDPRTETFQTWAIPSGGGVVRNMDVTADGNMVLACSAANRVALVEVKK